MPKFGRKANRDFQRFAKKLGVKRDFGKKLVSGIEKAGSVVGRAAEIAALANPELAPAAMAVKGISSQAGGLARSGVALTGKRPNLEQIGQQIESVKQSAKDLKVARDALQKKKPAPEEGEDSGIQFAD
jgi:hypothetical protein